MARSTRHHNKSQLCVFGLNTTGHIPSYHEVIRICAMPLDSEIQFLKDVLPFNIDIAPQFPERIDKTSKRAGDTLETCKSRGYHPIKAIELFETWFEKLELPTGKYGGKKKLIPLYFNAPECDPFIREFLGHETYKALFEHRYKDLRAAAELISDWQAAHAEEITFPKMDLNYVATRLSVTHELSLAEPIEQVKVISEAYRRLTMRNKF